MDANRPPRTPDSASTRFGDDASSGRRFSVQDVEQQVRSRSRRRSYSTSRSRRDERRETTSLERYTWVAVAGVAMVYLGFLAFSVIRPSAPKAKPEPPEVPVAAVESNPAPVDAIAEAPAVTEAPPLLMLEETVANLKKADLLFMEARRLARDNRLGEADATFAESVALAPDRFKVLFEWSALLRQQKRWAAARDLLIRAVAVEPDSVEARLSLAQCCYQLRQMPDALALAGWVLEAEPYSESAHQIAADVLTGMERYEAAIKHLQKLVALNSNNHIAENSLGAVYLRLGQFAQAASAFENVIRDEPGNSQAYYYLAQSFVLRNKPELAVDVLVRASQQFGRDFVLAWTKGSEFASLRDLPAFQQFFEAP